MMKRTTYIELVRAPLLVGLLTGMLLLFGVDSVGQDSSLIVICNSKGAPPDMKFSELKSVMGGKNSVGATEPK